MTRNKIAIFSSRGLGDGLLMMILSQHLSLKNDVVLFNSNLAQISNWFPHKIISPFPEDIRSALTSFDQIITTRNTLIDDWDDPRIFLLQDFDKKKTMVQNLVHICKETFHYPNANSDNGLQLPPYVKKMHYPNRIAIHATSSEDKKTWPKEKFIALAHKLKQRGHDVALCVASYERSEWEKYECENINIPRFATLEEFGTFVAESGYLIGNDSGIGHLASNIGIPTLSLFARGSHAKLWRPGWSCGKVVTPIPFAIGARAKQYLWKKLLPVNRVLKAVHTKDEIGLGTKIGVGLH